MNNAATTLKSKPTRPIDASRGFVVEAPRAIDAIGGALRNAFAYGGAMPPDMATMLAMIDRDDRSAPRGR